VDYDPDTWMLPPDVQPISVLIGLDGFQFIYAPQGDPHNKAKFVTTFVHAGHYALFSNHCWHSGGRNETNKVVYRIFIYLANKIADFPTDKVDDLSDLFVFFPPDRKCRRKILS
jgi:hypothetical protein